MQRRCGNACVKYSSGAMCKPQQAVAEDPRRQKVWQARNVRGKIVAETAAADSCAWVRAGGAQRERCGEA